MAEPWGPEKNLTNYGGGSYKRESENLHRSLREVHWSCVDIGASIRDALMNLHTIETRNADLRPVCERYIERLKELRDLETELIHKAGSLSSDLIRENGCDCSCEKSKK